MERKVEVINGKDLTIYQIQKFINIYCEVFEDEFDTVLHIKSPRELELFFDEEIENLYFAIGEDWFLVYSKVWEYIKFHLWGVRLITKIF